MKKLVSVGLLTLLGIGLSSHAAKAQLSVTSSLTAQQLLDLIIDPNDPNPTITVIGTPIYVGAPTASGSFTGGTSDNVGLGISSGLILTSGRAVDAVGPNTSDGTSTGNNTPGDTSLNSLINSSTFDAASLQFDFTSTTGNLFFKYVFASEEYNEFVYSFNDVFGFFLDGVNIALIPNTNTPVSIDNVNGGNPFGSGNATNPQFYNNNDPSNGGPFFNIEYDGFTDVFTASVIGLTPGQHTIKLAVADALDDALDSAVFLEGGSFSGEPPEPPTPTATPESSSLLSLLGIGILGIASAKLRKK